MWRTIFGAVGAAVLAGAAQAAALPQGGANAEEVAQVLQAKGYRAHIDRDAVGDPRITSGADGSQFQVLFYNCKDDRCASIQFATAFDLKAGMSLDQVNEWNRTKRFGRAYLDAQRDPFVVMDVDLERGATTEAVANYLDTWAAVVPAFKAFIDE